MTDFVNAPSFYEKLALAKATEYTRSIGNIRGSQANPDFMEERIRELVAGNDKVADIRVLDSQ